LLSDLLGHFRNLLIYVVARGDRDLLEVSESEAASLKVQAADIQSDALTRVMEVFADAEGKMREVSSRKILIEVTLLKAIEARNALSIEALLGRLNALRDSAESAESVTAKPAKTASPPVRDQPANVPARPVLPEISLPSAQEPVLTTQAVKPALAPDEPAADLERLWVQVLDAVGRASPFTRTYLLEAHPVSFERNVFLIGFDPEFKDHLGLVDNPKNRTLIQTKLGEFGHPNSQVKFVEAEAPVGRQRVVASAPEAAPTLKSPTPVANAKPPQEPQPEKVAPAVISHEEFKNDPLIKKALEIFKGQIVEVRV